MARSTYREITGIDWDADPDPEVFEYLVYMFDGNDEDIPNWLAEIDAGEVAAFYVVDAAITEFRLDEGHDPEFNTFAVVSHARNADTGVERWSSPYSPALWQNVPLGQAPADLAGVSGGALLYAD